MAHDGYKSGSDAAYIRPKLIPDGNLRPRDDSGGLGWHPHSGDWDDGGFILGGAKAHLSPGGGETRIHERRDTDSDGRGNEEIVDHRGPHMHHAMSPLKHRKTADPYHHEQGSGGKRNTGKDND